MWKLTKLKKGILEINKIVVEFEDTFSSIHLRDFYIEKYNLSPPCKIDKLLQPTLYGELCSLITEMNLFKDREEVPNKRVITDVPGLSKLVRKSDKSRIDLCFRAKNKAGVQEKMANSSNTCYISEVDSWTCYNSFCTEQGYRGLRHYVSKGHPLFEYWSEFMDKEYVRLAGVKYQKKGRPNRPLWTLEEKEAFDTCMAAYIETKRGSDLEILEGLTLAGFAMINNKKTSIYNRYGHWICSFEELLDKDSEAFMVSSILVWLNKDELKKARNIIEKSIEYNIN